MNTATLYAVALGLDCQGRGDIEHDRFELFCRGGELRMAAKSGHNFGQLQVPRTIQIEFCIARDGPLVHVDQLPDVLLLGSRLAGLEHARVQGVTHKDTPSRERAMRLLAWTRSAPAPAALRAISRSVVWICPRRAAQQGALFHGRPADGFLISHGIPHKKAGVFPRDMVVFVSRSSDDGTFPGAFASRRHGR